MSLQSTDPIADLLTRIRNAVLVRKSEIIVPSSKIKFTVATELKKARYIHDVKIRSAKPRDQLVLTINQPGDSPAITEIDRVSKPGRRVYVGSNDIPKVKTGRGMVLISTSKGVMPGDVAKAQKLGGEIILKVY